MADTLKFIPPEEIDRTELVKDHYGDWSRASSPLVNILCSGIADWFIFPDSLKRITLCVSKQWMPDAYKGTFNIKEQHAYRGWEWIPVLDGFKMILDRMGGGVLYIAVEIDAN